MSLILSQAVIANGQSLSGLVNLGNKILVGIWMPPVWTAASMTFQVSPDGGVTFLELYTSAGAEQTFTVAQGQFIAVDPTLWRGINSLIVRSGTAGAPVPQGQSTTVTLITV